MASPQSTARDHIDDPADRGEMVRKDQVSRAATPGHVHGGGMVTAREGGSDMSSAQLYDTIGATYTVTRRTEPRIAARIWAALGDARTVLNVGAGAGSYEPPGRDVTAVEPSAVMRAQRPAGAAPCVAAAAESLSVRGPVVRRRDGLCHHRSLAGPHRGPARDAAR